MHHFIVALALNGATARTETFLGRTFRVIPAVLVRSQVLNNNLGMTYLPADSITDEWAGLWNGIPVLVGPHPTERGQPSSGRSPGVWNERGVGWIFNAAAEQESADVRRLVGEVWIDEARAEAVEGLPIILERVANGEAVELSTGFPAQLEERVGLFQGQSFQAVMRPAGADHLVISAELTGACSVTDGCGLGVNAKEKRPMNESKAGTGNEKPTFLQAVLTRAGELIGVKSEADNAAWRENVALRIARETEALNAVEATDYERMERLRGALQRKFGGEDRSIVLMDSYSDSKQVIFYVHTPLGPQPPGPEYYRVTYTEGGEGGGFEFGETEKVRRMTSYELVSETAPAANTAARNCGCHQKKGEETAMQENEKKELLAEFSTQLDSALKPITASIAAIAESAKTAAEGVVNAAVEPLKAQIAELTAQVGDVVKSVNAERDAERSALVKELSSNSRTPFSEADLEAKPLDELRKIAQMANVQVTNYAGRGGPRETTRETESAFLEPVPYFAANKKPDAKSEEK